MKITDTDRCLAQGCNDPSAGYDYNGMSLCAEHLADHAAQEGASWYIPHRLAWWLCWATVILLCTLIYIIPRAIP